MTMKKGTRIFAAVILLLLMTAFLPMLVGCQREVTVTFVFENEPDDVVKVRYGGSVTPPEVPEKVGNVGHWEVDNFKRITKDLTVNAVYQTKWLEYTLINDGREYEVSIGDMDVDTEELYIPSEHNGLPVTKIADVAFPFSYHRVTTINLPDSLNAIGYNAFEAMGSGHVSFVVLPEGVTSMNEDAFCTWMKEQTIYVKGYTSRPASWSYGWNGKATIVWCG